MAQPLSARGAKQYAELQEAYAEAYGVESSARMFSVEPTIAQELNDAITAKADFLERINVTPVSEIKGEKVFIGVNGPVTGRTNTKTTDREAKDASALAAVQKRIAQDRIVIGFHGTHAAPQTDLEKFPKLQDVNKGWLQQLREQAPQQVLKEGATAGKVTLGAGGDYANLDALVHDTKQMVDEILREDGDLVAIIGTDLLAADKAKLYTKQGDTPTEKERIENAQVIATYGGLPAFSVPNFPVNAVLVTSWDNLSIYFQDTSWRKQTIENPKRSRVEDYNSRNEGYVIEQLEKIAFTENVELVK